METRTVILITDRAAHVATYVPGQRAWSRATLRTIGVRAPLLPQSASDVGAYAKRIANAMIEECPAGIEATLIVPSSWCLIKTVEVAGDSAVRSAAEFEFEQFVPCPLERFTCVVSARRGNTAQVAAVFTEALGELFETMEREGVTIASATVDALVAAEAYGGDDNRHPGPLILVDDIRWVAVPLRSTDELREIMHFTVSPAATPVFLAHKERVLTASTPYVDGAAPAFRSRNLALRYASDGVRDPFSADAFGSRGSNEVSAIEGILDHVANCDSVAELRSGALAYPGRWRAVRCGLWRCTALLVAFLVVAGAGLHLENSRYANELRSLSQRRAGLFLRVFPGVEVKPGAALHVRSERIKLEGLTEGAGGGLAELRSDGLAAFQLLHRVTSAIPTALKVHLDTITLETAGLKLEGRTTSHNAAGDLVKALNADGDLRADPPRTKLRKDGTVDFHLSVAKDGSGEP